MTFTERFRVVTGTITANWIYVKIDDLRASSGLIDLLRIAIDIPATCDHDDSRTKTNQR